MKKTTGLMAGASRFAHFAGLTRASRRAAEDDDRDDNARAEDDDDGKDASDDDGDQDEPKGKRSRRADEDDDGKDASDDNGDEDEPKGKRSRRAEDDDDGKDASDDEDELNGKGASAQARRREQARIAHILGHKAAANNLPLALSLACETRMSRSEAVSVLKSQSGFAGSEAREDRSNRHARTDRQGRNVALGSDSQQPSGKQAVDASWAAAFGKAGVSAKAR